MMEAGKNLIKRKFPKDDILRNGILGGIFHSAAVSIQCVWSEKDCCKLVV